MAQSINLLGDEDPFKGVAEQSRVDPPMIVSDGTIQYVSPVPASYVDPAAAIRTAFSRRREVLHEVEIGDGEKIAVKIRSMSAGQRSNYFGSVSTLLTEDATAKDVLPLNVLLVHYTVFTLTGDPVLPGDPSTDAGLAAMCTLASEFDAGVIDGLVDVAQEVCGIAAGTQPVSNEEDVTVKG